MHLLAAFEWNNSPVNTHNMRHIPFGFADFRNNKLDVCPYYTHTMIENNILFWIVLEQMCCRAFYYGTIFEYVYIHWPISIEPHLRYCGESLGISSIESNTHNEDLVFSDNSSGILSLDILKPYDWNTNCTFQSSERAWILSIPLTSYVICWNVLPICFTTYTCLLKSTYELPVHRYTPEWLSRYFHFVYRKNIPRDIIRVEQIRISLWFY